MLAQTRTFGGSCGARILPTLQVRRTPQQLRLGLVSPHCSLHLPSQPGEDSSVESLSNGVSRAFDCAAVVEESCFSTAETNLSTAANCLEQLHAEACTLPQLRRDNTDLEGDVSRLTVGAVADYNVWLVFFVLPPFFPDAGCSA